MIDSNTPGSPMQVTDVDISPDVRVLGVFRHLNYKPWYAMAEFVDNALDSFLTNRRRIEAVDGRPTRLVVKILLDTNDPGTIVISDNAAGISVAEWKRALKPAEPPLSTVGLSEFGMGMKTAACWFGRHLVVESKGLGEPVRCTAHLNFDEIIAQRTGKVRISSSQASPNEHGTTITLRGFHRPLHPRTIGKIHDHLSSMFRIFLRDQTLDLIWQVNAGDEEKLKPENVEILNVPMHDRADGTPIVWRKDNMDIDLGDGVRAKGWAALRAKGNTAKAGFALFRAGRLIQGSDDETYRPSAIFGASTTAIYQRLFGEFHMYGLGVAHTKDGFRWEDKEDLFIDELRKVLDQGPLPLLTQAKRYPYEMQRKPGINLSAEARDALESTAAVIQKELPKSEVVKVRSSEETPPPQELGASRELLPHAFEVEINNETWKITTEFSNDQNAQTNWIELAHKELATLPGRPHQLRLRLSLRHPFTERYIGVEYENLELMLRFGASLVLAEVFARQAGARGAGEVRRQMNLLLKDVFSKD